MNLVKTGVTLVLTIKTMVSFSCLTVMAILVGRNQGNIT
ncbi:uncharacterized protein METZ01_LOCUS158966, partial [marine metagenome]